MTRRRARGGSADLEVRPARMVSRRSAWVLLGVAVLGMAGTLLASAGLARGEDRLAGRLADQQAAAVARAVVDGVRRYSDYLTALAASVGAQQQLEAAEFDAITAPLDRVMLPGVTGVAFVVPASTRQVGAVQAYWRARGAAGLALQPLPARTSEHLFLVLGRSADQIPTPVGRDLVATGEPREAMYAARRDRQVVMSATYHLTKDTRLPPGQRPAAFVMATAVYATAPAADAGRLRGWLLLSLRGGDFLHDSIGTVTGQGAVVALSDLTAHGPVPVVQWRPSARPDPAQPARTLTVEVPGRTWQLTVEPTRALVTRHGLPAHLVAVLVGAALTVLLTALTASVVTSRDRAVRRVHAATEALQHDILRREAAELQLRHRETELRGFVGVVAHDLRSPLARILGYTDLLRDGDAGHLTGDQRELADRLHRGARHMSNLLDELLDYATADSRPLHLQPVDLQHLIAEIIPDQAATVTGRTVTVTTDPLPVLYGDPTLLRQVFDNLIGNAVKYTAPTTAPHVHVAGRRDGDHWRIEVTDNGIGVPADQRETIFAAFTRADHGDYPGTGLGLAIVHRAVERHHGSVGIEPHPDGGSRFWIALPAYHASA